MLPILVSPTILQKASGNFRVRIRFGLSLIGIVIILTMNQLFWLGLRLGLLSSTRLSISDFTSMSGVVHKYKARSVSSGAREASSTQRKVYGKSVTGDTHWVVV